MHLGLYLACVFVGATMEAVNSACVADIVFILDRSGSTREYGYVNEKRFVKRVATAFKIGAAFSRAGVVSFADTARIEIECGQHSNTLDFNAAVDRMLAGDEYTNIYDGLLKAKTLFLGKCHRTGAQKLAFLLTDGIHNTGSSITGLVAVAQDLRSRGVRLFVLGIGAFVSPAQLETIAGGKVGIYYSKNFDELVTDAFVASVLGSICTLPFPEEFTSPPSTTKATTKAAPTTTKPTPKIVCESAPADVCLVLDQSGSVINEWDKTKSFAKQLVDAFRVSKDGIHVGIVTFATSSYVKVYLDDCLTSDCVSKKIDQFGPSSGGFTNLNLALVQTRDQVLFNTNRGSRRDSKSASVHVILVSDGAASPFYKEDGSTTANDIRQRGGAITVLAIGNDQRLPLLRKIADGPANFKTAANFDQLLEPAFLAQFVKEVCRVF